MVNDHAGAAARALRPYRDTTGRWLRGLARAARTAARKRASTSRIGRCTTKRMKLLARARAPGRADRRADAVLIGGWRDLLPSGRCGRLCSGSTHRSSLLVRSVAPRPARHRRTRAGRLAVDSADASGERAPARRPRGGHGAARDWYSCRVTGGWRGETGVAAARGRVAHAAAGRPAAYSPTRRSPTASDEYEGTALDRRYRAAS